MIHMAQMLFTDAVTNALNTTQNSHNHVEYKGLILLKMSYHNLHLYVS